MPNLKFKLLKSRLEWTLTYSCHFEEKKAMEVLKFAKQKHLLLLQFPWRKLVIFLQLSTISSRATVHDRNRTITGPGLKGVGGNYRVKMDQTWSNWISDESLKYIIRFSNLFTFSSKWIRSVQNGSNLMKLNFWWKNHWNISSDFQSYLSFDQIFKFFFDQNGLDLSKLDQTWSNWISDEIIIEIYHKISNFIYFLIRLN